MIYVTYSIAIILMIIVPVILPILWRRYVSVPWLIFCAGMLTFTISQLVHLPLNQWLTDLGLLAQPGQDGSPPLWQIALILGLTAGLCEELARAGAYLLMKRIRSPIEGVMLGLGHGGIESMVFGGILTAATFSSLVPLIGQDLTRSGIPAEQIAAIATQLSSLVSSPWLAGWTLLERLLAISIHIVFSLLILETFRQKSPWYLILAIVYHAILDATLVYMGQEYANPLLTRISIVVMCIPGWVWAVRLLRNQGSLHVFPKVFSWSQEWRILRLAFHKEILQMWRTHRFLVILTVFGVFGMISPLMAYFMPEIFKAIPGAEQFAGLIPPPTQADALTQYVKNISQFGFLLAIMLGMSEVAGEKERGTASMILSKPMPRWIFVTSKFLAQLLVFLIGFLLAWIGGYFYTLVLFKPAIPIDLASQYAWINLLMYLWLSAFVTITLISSVLASSVTAAGGIAVTGAIVLMLAGNIPKIGMLLPGALMTWANQLSLTPTVDFNGGALAACLVFTLIGLIVSIAFFESQELT